MSHAFLAVDWGTSSRRVHRIHDGEVLATERDDRGAAAVAAGDFASEAAAIRAGCSGCSIQPMRPRLRAEY